MKWLLLVCLFLEGCGRPASIPKDTCICGHTQPWHTDYRDRCTYIKETVILVDPVFLVETVPCKCLKFERKYQ